MRNVGINHRIWDYHETHKIHYAANGICFLDSKKLCLLLCILEGQPTLWLLTHPVESNLLHIYCMVSLFTPLFCFYTSLESQKQRMLLKAPVSNPRKSNWVLSHLGDGSGHREGKTPHCFTSCVLSMAFHLALPAFVKQNAAVSALIPEWHSMDVFTQGWSLAWGILLLALKHTLLVMVALLNFHVFADPQILLQVDCTAGAMIWIYPLRNVY